MHVLGMLNTPSKSVTAALDTSIAGFTPVVWMLLAFILYVTMIFSVVLRIMTHLESKR